MLMREGVKRARIRRSIFEKQTLIHVSYCSRFKRMNFKINLSDLHSTENNQNYIYLFYFNYNINYLFKLL